MLLLWAKRNTEKSSKRHNSTWITYGCGGSRKVGTQEGRRRERPGHLPLGTTFNLFLYWEFFKKIQNFTGKRVAAVYSVDPNSAHVCWWFTNLHNSVNPEASWEELLCWVVDWAGKQKHTCMASKLPLVLFRVGTSSQAVSRHKQGRLSKKKVGYSWFNIYTSYSWHKPYLWLGLGF